MRVVPLLIALLVCGCNEATAPNRLSAPSDAAFDKTVNSKDEQNVDILPDPSCQGERIMGLADEHIQTKSKQGKDGTYSLSMRVDDHIKAYGQTSGAKYEGMTRADIAFSNMHKGETQYTEYDLHLVGQGQIPNLRLRAKASTFVPADGGDPVIKTSYSQRCK